MTTVDRTCCFFGHRKIPDLQIIQRKTEEMLETLIVKWGVDTFLFGSKSAFDDLCYNIVTRLKEKYPDIKRVYIRGEFPDIDEDYQNYLLQFYESTYFPKEIRSAGRAVYIERNAYMIDRSAFCVIYYDPEYLPACPGKDSMISRRPVSGTSAAYKYAVRKKKTMINIFESVKEQ